MNSKIFHFDLLCKLEVFPECYQTEISEEINSIEKMRRIQFVKMNRLLK